MPRPRFLSLFILLLLLSPLPLGSRGIASDEALPFAALDRIEEGKAVMVLEDGSCFVIPVSLLPAAANEGDCLGFAVTKDEAKRSFVEKPVAANLDGLLGGPR